MHESSLYSRNSFLTLTFSPDKLPSDNSLHYIYFQDFMKRLREAHRGCDEVTHPYAGTMNLKTGKPYPDTYRPIRFYMCGEYGENRGRPHFHACLFNFDFDDKRVWRKTSQGHPVWRSPSLEALWPHGFSEIGSVSFQSAAYVARYIMKKANGRSAEAAYEWVDPVTGEVHSRTPEFTKMSLKPGIAEGWISKFMTDVYPHDYVVINGRKCKPPRYYDRKYFNSTSELVEDHYLLSNGTDIVLNVPASADYEALEFDRWENFQEHLEDNTPERLSIKETVTQSRVDRLKRSLK